MIAMGINIKDPFSFQGPQEDDLTRYLRINNTTLAQEVEKIKQKKSGLSARLREVALYRFEKQREA